MKMNTFLQYNLLLIGISVLIYYLLLILMPNIYVEKVDLEDIPVNKINQDRDPTRKNNILFIIADDLGKEKTTMNKKFVLS